MTFATCKYYLILDLMGALRNMQSRCYFLSISQMSKQRQRERRDSLKVTKVVSG